MNITAIKLIINNSPSEVEVRNTENPRKFRNGGLVGAGRVLRVDMWIPWATEPGDLSKHSISVNLGRGRTRTIHQGADVDGDFVRLSPARGSRFPGPPIPGAPQVGGDREMTISRTGAISLRAI